ARTSGEPKVGDSAMVSTAVRSPDSISRLSSGSFVEVQPLGVWIMSAGVKVAGKRISSAAAGEMASASRATNSAAGSRSFMTLPSMQDDGPFRIEALERDVVQEDPEREPERCALDRAFGLEAGDGAPGVIARGIAV